MTKHTKHARFRSIGTLLMIFGTGVSVLGAETQSLHASLTDQGSYLGTTQATEPMLMARYTICPATVARAAMWPAAMEQTGPSFGMIALGMLIVLIGIGLHGLYVLRSRDGRAATRAEPGQSVPVRIRKQKAPQKEARKSRRQAEVIWIERTIRF